MTRDQKIHHWQSKRIQLYAELTGITESEAINKLYDIGNQQGQQAKSQAIDSVLTTHSWADKYLTANAPY